MSKLFKIERRKTLPMTHDYTCPASVIYMESNITSSVSPSLSKHILLDVLLLTLDWNH